MGEDDAKIYTGCLIVGCLALFVGLVAVVWWLVAWLVNRGAEVVIGR